jgi:DNA-binding transcriptional ArsR family regulator
MTNEQPANLARAMDLESLKALAHPLRVKIVDVLSTYGAFTASGLGERLGESSGATSYHLRQLEKHGFVREVEGRGTARERWWERVPGAISLDDTELRESPAGKAASQLVLQEWTNSRERTLRDYVEHGDDVLSAEWQEASELSLANIVVTAEQLKEISDQFMAVMDAAVARYRGQKIPGARSTQLQIAAFPVIDGIQYTGEES